MKTWVLLSAILLVGFGCELPEGQATGTATDKDSVAEDIDQVITNSISIMTNAVPEVDDDETQWDLIKWQGPSGAGAKKVMELDASIESGGHYANFSFERYPWKEYAMGCFFVWDGSAWRGGKFDWIRTGGQSRKTLENIHAGYNGLRKPSSGTKVAFAWTDGKTRSNLAITKWP